MKTIRRLFLLLLLLVCAVSCSDRRSILADKGDSEDRQELLIGISLGKVAVDIVARAELIVTGADMETITVELAIDEGRLKGSVVVPTGAERVFTINAYDGLGTLIYQGTAKAMVSGDGKTVLPAISVYPVGATPIYPQEKTLRFPGEYGVEYVGSEDIEFVLVPGGPFIMGSDAGPSYVGPERVISLKPFYIGKYEITTEQFLELMIMIGDTEMPTFRPDSSGDLEFKEQAKFYHANFEGGNARSRIVIDNDGRFIVSTRRESDGAQKPIYPVTWYGAKFFCETIGGRLPTNAEWEKAARGIDGRRFPWGDTVEGGESNLSFMLPGSAWGVATVGSYTGDVSPYGVYGMGGNVSEWVSDWFDPDYYFYAPADDPGGPLYSSSYEVTVRGGAGCCTTGLEATAFYRYGSEPTKSQGPREHGRDIGFRCAADP